jgi:hypothetical protein
VHQIHDGLLNDRGQGLADGHVDRVTTRYGGAYTRLSTGESVDV